MLLFKKMLQFILPFPVQNNLFFEFRNFSVMFLFAYFIPVRNSSNSWNFLEHFLKNCLNAPSTNKTELTVHEKRISNILSFIGKLVATCPPLIDRVWYFFASSIVPYLTELNLTFSMASDNSASSSGSSASPQNSLAISTVISYIISCFSSLPWEKATFHYNDPETISQMLSLFEFPAAVTCLIFTKLDWSMCAKTLEERNTALGSPYKYSNGNVAKFLSFFVSLNIVSPTSIPSSLRSLIFGISTNEDWFFSNQFIFEWRGIPPEEFQAEFNGERLVSLVKSM
jgi:hypothetical protein